VLPDVTGEDGLAGAVTERAASIVSLDNLELLGLGVLDEPGPARAKVAGGSGGELLLELVEAAKVPLNGVLDGTGGGTAGVGGEAVPVEGVVPGLGSAVEDRSSVTGLRKKKKRREG